MTKPGMSFRSVALNNEFVLLIWHGIVSHHRRFRCHYKKYESKVSFNPDNGRRSVMNFRSPGPVARQTSAVELNAGFLLQSPFNGQYLKSKLCPFQKNMAAVIIQFYVSFCVGYLKKCSNTVTLLKHQNRLKYFKNIL